MPKLHRKLTDWILGHVRRQPIPSPTQEQGPREAVTIREANFSDFPAVSELTLRLGQGPDSIENWYRLWRDNPALAQKGSSRIGWVLETPTKIVGFLGTITLIYTYKRRQIVASATCRFAVEPAYRAWGHLLITSFFRQKESELFLNTSATPTAAKMVLALGAVALPQPEYDTVLFWIINRGKFADWVLSRLGMRDRLKSIATKFLSIAIRVEQSVKQGAISSFSGLNCISTAQLGDLGIDFEKFTYENVQTEKLWASRSRKVLEWHFLPPGTRRNVVVMLCHHGGELVGYAIVRHDTERIEGLRRSLIVDLQAKANGASIIRALIIAARKNAHEAGTDLLEIVGFPREVRDIAEQLKPYFRQLPASPFYFKARNNELHGELKSKESWYATPLDGDSTLWP